MGSDKVEGAVFELHGGVDGLAVGVGDVGCADAGPLCKEGHPFCARSSGRWAYVVGGGCASCLLGDGNIGFEVAQPSIHGDAPMWS